MITIPRRDMRTYKPIRFCSFGGYSPFTIFWWSDVLWYGTGISCFSRSRRTVFTAPGWCRDIYTYWHRARYGWAPRDTWSLDHHLNQVLAGTLAHLADHTIGCPSTYDDCDQWEEDLRRWSRAFNEDPLDSCDDADAARRHANIHTTLKELEPVWDYLWD